MVCSMGKHPRQGPLLTLEIAVLEMDFNMITALIGHGADVRFRGEGEQPLGALDLRSNRCRDKALVRLLLEVGVDETASCSNFPNYYGVVSTRAENCTNVCDGSCRYCYLRHLPAFREAARISTKPRAGFSAKPTRIHTNSCALRPYGSVSYQGIRLASLSGKWLRRTPTQKSQTR